VKRDGVFLYLAFINRLAESKTRTPIKKGKLREGDLTKTSKSITHGANPRLNSGTTQLYKCRHPHRLPAVLLQNLIFM
jgi:hypothetical protein